MKKYILLFAIISFLQNKNIHAQNQFFPSKNASWEEAFIGIIGVPLPTYNVLCGDTLIAGKTYSKMYSLQLDSMGVETERQYLGGTRLDLDMVFYLESGSSQEYLLYDFALEAGQSITLQTVFGMNTLTVGSNQLINTPDGVIRRVINFINSNGMVIETWIEGIGSDLGVINRGIDLSQVADFDPYMNCYKFNGQIGWSNPVTNPDCDFTFEELCESTSIDNLINEKNITFTVFPNPFSEKTVVEIQGFQHLNSPIFHIYNLQGQLLEKYEGISEEKFNFFRKNLNAGVYVFELLDGKTTFAVRKKIIVF